MKRGKVVIIPDENQILESVYEREIYNEEEHIKGYQEFSNKYHLGFSFKDTDYQTAPLDLARLGHMSYKTVGDELIIIFYIPCLITDNQLEYFEKNYFNFRQCRIIGAYSIREVEQGLKIVQLNEFQKIREEFNIKNRQYNKEKESEKHVR